MAQSDIDITVSQAAELLKVSENTIERWIRQGVIPVYRVESGYSFKAEELKAWVNYKNLGNIDMDSSILSGASHIDEDESINVLEAIRHGGIHYDIHGDVIEDIFQDALSRLDFGSSSSEEIKDNLYQSLIEREKLASTGLGEGIAVPHPRKPSDWGLHQPMISIMFLDREVDFSSIDGKPVFVLFLILCSTVKGHLRILSQVSHIIHTKEAQNFLREKPDPVSLMEFIVKSIKESGK